LRKIERSGSIVHERTDEVGFDQDVGEAAGGLVGRVPLTRQLRVRVLLVEVAVVGEGVAEDVEAEAEDVAIVLLVPAQPPTLAVAGVVPCSEPLGPGRLDTRYCTRSIN
jgi:hypothetical protein